MTSEKTTRLPFPFVIDELTSIRPTIRHAFGFTYVYLDDRLLCGLRNSSKQPRSNGIWLFTTVEHSESLLQEFPQLSRRYLWRSGKNAWIILPSRLGEFEEYALKACELILNGDRRIGRLSRGRADKRPRLTKHEENFGNWFRRVGKVDPFKETG